MTQVDSVSLDNDKIEAIGWEKFEFRNSRIGIPSLLLVAGGLAFCLTIYLSSFLLPPTSQANAITFFSILGPCGALMVVSGGVLAYYNATTSTAKPLEIVYSDMRDVGGALLLSYTTSTKKPRKQVMVKEVIARPGVPLIWRVGRGRGVVKGTHDSIRIRLQGKRYIELGFPDLTEMDFVYERLKSPAAPRLERY